MNSQHQRHPIRHLLRGMRKNFYALALESGRNYAAADEQEIRRHSESVPMPTYAWFLPEAVEPSQ